MFGVMIQKANIIIEKLKLVINLNMKYYLEKILSTIILYWLNITLKSQLKIKEVQYLYI